MALSKSTITGRVPLPTDENLQFAELTFALSGLDTEGASVLPGGISTRAVLVGSDIPAGFELWQNTAGLRGTHYRVLARWTVKDRDGVRDKYADLGIIQVGSDPSYTLAYLINSGVPQAVGTFWSALTQAQYDAAIGAAIDAQAWAESPTAPGVPGTKSSKTWAAEAAASAADALASATAAALYDGPWLDTVSALIADTSLTYTPAQPSTVSAGDYVRTRAEGFAYQVAASGAVDQHVTTAGGVKLYYAGVDATEPARGLGIVIGSAEYSPNNIGPGSVNINGDVQFPNRLPGWQRLRAILGGYDNEIIGSVGGDGSGLACVIAGSHHSIINGSVPTHNSIFGGSFHTITGGDYSVITGGQLNVITGGTDYGTVSGGGSNEINMAAGNDYGTIGGGYNNTVTGRFGGVFSGNTNLASGTYAVIIGGQENTASGQHAAVTSGFQNAAGGRAATVAGGENNTITGGVAIGDYAGMVGGFQNQIGNTAAARFSGMVGGRANTINGELGAIIGGRENSVTAEAGVAMGYGARSINPGAMAQAGGYFSGAGDAQTVRLVMRRQTTDATATELRLGSTLGARLALENDSTYAFSVLLVGRNTGADESAAYRLDGCIDVTAAGAAALVGAVTKTVIAEDVAAWDVAALADEVNKALQITVTGEGGKTIKWVASVELVKVTG